MRSMLKLLRVTPSRFFDRVQFSQLLSLTILLALAVVMPGCGAASPTNTIAPSKNAAGQIAVSLPPAQAKVGVAYNAVPSVSGGTAPYLFVPAGGTLPPGISMSIRTGSISGVPTVAGDYSFNLDVSDPPRTDHGTVVVHIVVAANSIQNAHITLSPSTTTVVSQGTLQFSASVTGTSNTAVVWSATPGTISSSGLFTAPKVSSDTPVTVTATGATDGTLRASATLTVTPLTALAISSSVLAESNVGMSYSASLAATGGVLPYQWSLSSGTLPVGFQLQASGVVSGTTSISGSYTFTARVKDSAGNSSTRQFTLPVSSLSATGFDGPAELPRVYLQTTMANTPAPGTTVTVKSGGDLQSALNSANCGDTVTLQAGATFTGVFTFPAKSCDDNHWIVVRTSSDDSVLPAEGSRLTPCYAGVASLPGRPAFQCSSTSNVLAKLVMAGHGNGPILFAAGANHYRLVGLEVTRVAGTGIVYALSSLAVGGSANNLIFDRMWLHGTARDETNKGVELGGSSSVSVIDSFLTDFHCISYTGSCSDAVAIGGGTGNPVGPFKISDNFLEAAGENVIFGGAEATITPADIEISRNHFFKPMTWMKGQPGYVGGADGNPFVVKNLFELKNAQRVLLEANIMENSWGGFSQSGFAVVISPKNQAASNSLANLCPICQVTDVTIRYNTMSHLGAGLQIANALSDNGGAALDGQRYSIHDITIDDINALKYAGTGRFAEVMTMALAPLLQNVAVNHVTAFTTSGMLNVGGQLSPRMANVTFTNNIFYAGQYPVWSTGGGVTNCAYYDKPVTTLDACFGTHSFGRNAVIASPSAFPPTVWPSGNFFPATSSALQFVNYSNANGGNYHLLSTSPYHNAGTDGKDLGADVSTILSETVGVY
ncbi:MAG TPA: putative Ig domain-containing protein [Candidatus Binatus sp.]|nr:putative Ig domain-containing protein [Candidatus Binatus sp.]